MYSQRFAKLERETDRSLFDADDHLTFFFQRAVIDKLFDSFQTEPSIAHDIQTSLNDRWWMRQGPEIREEIVFFDGHRGIGGDANSFEFREDAQGGKDVDIVNGEFMIDLS